MNRYRIRKLKEIMGSAPTWDTGQEMLFQVVQILKVEAKVLHKSAKEVDYSQGPGAGRGYEQAGNEVGYLADGFRKIIADDCGRCGGVGDIGSNRPCPRCQV